jgi:hypothetical protein
MHLVRRTSVLLAGALVAAGAVVLPVQAATGPTTLAVTGTIRTVGVDGHDGASRLQYVETDDGSRIPVDLPPSAPATGRFSGELRIAGDVARTLDEADLLPGRGAKVAEDTRAGRLAVLTAEGQATPLAVEKSDILPVGVASAVVSSAHRAYVAVMTNRGGGGAGAPTVEGAEDAVAKAGAYWVAQSGGGITSFARIGAVVSYASTIAETADGTCGTASPWDMWDEAASKFDVNFNAPGNHLIVMVDASCAVGLGTIGDSLADGGYVVMQTGVFAESIGAHEVGHNVGLEHANFEACSPTCAISPYDDLYSVMGLSTQDTPQALDTPYRVQLGVTAADEVPTVRLAEGPESRSFLLQPRSATSGQRGLAVVDPSTNDKYYVEYRSGTGFDATSVYASGATNGNKRYDPGVTVATVAQTDLSAATPKNAVVLKSRLISGVYYGSLSAGTSWVSPNGAVRVAVDTTSGAGGANVTVSFPEATDVQSATPTLSGTVAVGQLVTAVPGAWATGASFAYDWRLDGISTGATGQSYLIPPSALGRPLTVAVTGSKPGYLPVTRVSAASSVVVGTFVPGLVSSSPAAVGSIANSYVGGWPADAVLSYQWVADGVPVAGATSWTFTVPEALFGKTLRVVVTGSRQGYAVASASSPGGPVAPGRITTKIPKITGTAKVGRTLKVTTGSWLPRPSFTYQWYANGKRIAKKGTKTSFKLTAKQKGKRITVKVTARKTGYMTITKSSKKTRKVANK